MSQPPGPSFEQHAAPPPHRSLAAAFERAIDPVPVSLAYRCGLLMVTCAMLLLPLLYLALIALVVFGLYYHATTSVRLFTSDGPLRHIFLRVLLYVTPLVAGTIMVAFMIKPLFARSARRVSPYAIDRAREPVLFEFVERIAAAIGAPMPREIEVSSEINASAGFRKGVLSIFSDDLVLVIGMPLVAGFNTRQLAGVIAHELGHFAQRAGMRLTYIIRQLNFWFMRVVYERDRWDETIEQLANDLGGWGEVMLTVSQLCIWLSRRILWVFMFIGHLLSTFLLRQMEFNADLHQIRLAGSSAFESATVRYQELDAASDYVNNRLQQSEAAGRLSDDYPRLIVAATRHIPPYVREAMRKDRTTAETRLLSTHPSFRDRLAASRAENAPGVFMLEAPASSLFRQYHALCKWITIGHYREILGSHINIEQLLPVEKIIGDQELEFTSVKAVTRYFQKLISPRRLLPLGDHHAFDQPVDWQSEQQRLRQVRQRFEAMLPSTRKAYDAYGDAAERYDKLHIGRQLLQFDIHPSLGGLKLPSLSQRTADRALADAQQSMDSAAAVLHRFEHISAERLTAALRLSRCPTIAAKINISRKLQGHLDHLFATLAALHDARQHMHDAQLQSMLLTALALYLNAAKKVREDLDSTFHRIAHDLYRQLNSVRLLLSSQMYPLEHSRDRLTIAAYVIPLVPPVSDTGALCHAAYEANRRFQSLYYLSLGRIAIVAERVERAIGLPPLPEPSNDDADDSAAAMQES